MDQWVQEVYIGVNQVEVGGVYIHRKGLVQRFQPARTFKHNILAPNYSYGLKMFDPESKHMIVNLTNVDI